MIAVHIELLFGFEIAGSGRPAAIQQASFYPEMGLAGSQKVRCGP
jgi:hypothetical protein